MTGDIALYMFSGSGPSMTASLIPTHKAIKHRRVHLFVGRIRSALSARGCAGSRFPHRASTARASTARGTSSARWTRSPRSRRSSRPSPSAGPLTGGEIAERSGVSERYVREWCSAQAASGFLVYEPADETFALSPEPAMAFADEDSPVYTVGGYHVISAAYKDRQRITERIRHGQGVGRHEHDPELFAGTEQFFRSGYQAVAPARSLASTPCRAYRQSTFHGVDYHHASIHRAAQPSASAIQPSSSRRGRNDSAPMRRRGSTAPVRPGGIGAGPIERGDDELARLVPDSASKPTSTGHTDPSSLAEVRHDGIADKRDRGGVPGLLRATCVAR
jgi:winged helix-turn-helix protein